MNDTARPPSAFAEERDAYIECLRGAMAFRGVDPDSRLFEDGPALGVFAEDVRRISILEVAPIEGIQYLKRTSLKLNLDREVQENLWRAYDRQIRDELDHGAYWGEFFFMLTGQEPEAKPWDGEGMGASNVNIKIPRDSDDPERNRRQVFLGSAFSLGLESGFAEIVFPDLMGLMRRSQLELAHSFLPLLQQLGRDESRHLNIHRYVFHVLRESLGEGSVEMFQQGVNAGRRAFQVPEFTQEGFKRYLGSSAPPATKGVLGGNYIRLS